MGANGKRAIDRIVALTPTERRKFFFPELKDEHCDGWIYFPTATKATLDAALPQDDVERPASTTGLFLLVQLAEYEDGSKVFRRTDIDQLRSKARLDLVNRLESAMWDTQLPEIKEAEKQIEADPTSASA
jgi:hypothetical protein